MLQSRECNGAWLRDVCNQQCPAAPPLFVDVPAPPMGSTVVGVPGDSRHMSSRAAVVDRRNKRRREEVEQLVPPGKNEVSAITGPTAVLMGSNAMQEEDDAMPPPPDHEDEMAFRYSYSDDDETRSTSGGIVPQSTKTTDRRPCPHGTSFMDVPAIKAIVEKPVVSTRLALA